MLICGTIRVTIKDVRKAAYEFAEITSSIFNFNVYFLIKKYFLFSFVFLLDTNCDLKMFYFCTFNVNFFN